MKKSSSMTPDLRVSAPTVCRSSSCLTRSFEIEELATGERKAGPAANFLSNAAWIDNDSFIYAAEGVFRYKITDEASEQIVDNFAPLHVDVHASSGKMLYSVNGQSKIYVEDLK